MDQGNCYIYYKWCYILSIDEHYIRSGVTVVVVIIVLIIVIGDTFFLSSKKKYLFYALAIVCELLVDLSSIFNICVSSVILSLPDSNFTVSQMVLILLCDSRI